MCENIRQMSYLCGVNKLKMENQSILEEPMLTYGAIDDNNVFRFVDAVRKGIAYLFFVKLVKNSPFNLQEWSGFLHLSERTLQRHKKENSVFDPVSSEKILEITMLYNYGNDVFGNKEKFGKWLNNENIALGGICPKALLDCSFGIQIVKDELTRIEHGVFA